MKKKNLFLYSVLIAGGLTTLGYYWSNLLNEVKRDKVSSTLSIKATHEEPLLDEAPKTLSNKESSLHRFFYLSKILTSKTGPKKDIYPYILSPESLCLIDSSSYYKYLENPKNLLAFSVQPGKNHDIFIPFSKKHVHKLSNIERLALAEINHEVPFNRIIKTLKPIAKLNEKYQKLITESKNCTYKRYHHNIKFLNVLHFLEDVNHAFPNAKQPQDEYSKNDLGFVNIVRFLKPESDTDPYFFTISYNTKKPS